LKTSISEQNAPPFFKTTWGMISLVNGAIFVAMALYSGSVFMPSTEAIILFGAKEPTLIVKGEWWRLITSMFVHIGIIHFAFNTYALKVIGPQVEQVLGGKLFLFVYLITGFVGSLCSSVFNVNISAGASGAIMGLLGTGLFIELHIRKQIHQSTGLKPRAGAYMTNAVGILIMGLIIPNIDNAAHLGGLISGHLMAQIIFRLKPNRFMLVDRLAAYKRAWIGAAITICLAVLSVSEGFATKRFLWLAESSEKPSEKYFYLSRAIALQSESLELRILRVRICLDHEFYNDAIADVNELIRSSGGRQKLLDLQVMYENQGQQPKADFIKQSMPDHFQRL
jgi:rhomboid protease GluP